MSTNSTDAQKVNGLSPEMDIALSQLAPNDAGPTVYGDMLFSAETLVDPGWIKEWDSAAFTLRPVKVWNGTGWVIKPLKIWDGSAWVMA